MNIKRINKKSSHLVAGMMLATVSLSSNAAPGTLSDSPLFLATSVEPNIFWTLDDSGSMEWEFMVSDGSSGLPTIGGWNGNYYVLPSANNGQDKYYVNTYGSDYHPYTLSSEASVPGAWRGFNKDYNKLYYDPAVTYDPWPGTDGTGTPLYADATATAAKVDPNNALAGTLNLTANITYYGYAPSAGYWHWTTVFPATYYEWTDSDSDGYVDESDAHTLVEIKPATATYSGRPDRDDCAAAPVCTYAEEIQNFANWFQYYRKRKYVAFAAMGGLVQGSSSDRMGLQVFNTGLISNATSMGTSANKVSLLSSLYGLAIPCDSYAGCPGTPARNSMKAVGTLFEGGSTPILSAANGGACQQNFNVLLTDGYWNGGSPSVGNTDGDNSSDYDSNLVAPYGDSYSNTLADVAMHYYERDLSALDDDVPSIAGVDDAEHQHLVTYTVAFGVSGTLNPQTQSPTDTGFAWPNPASGDAQKIDDLWHAAYNGRGQFLSAQNPAQLESALDDALSNIADRTGSAAAVAFNTSTLTTGSAVFLVLFNSNKWSGKVYKYELDPVSGAVAVSPEFEASAVLDARVSSRIMLTHNGTTGVPFQWANISTAQKNDLKTNAAGGTDSDTIGQARLDYIRGARGNEGSGYNFRDRASRLGDIVHSNPVYVEDPDMGWPDSAPFPTGSASYANWKATVSRTAMIYVGANDGMTHAFRASDGEEMLAYLPSNMFSTSSQEGLHYLTDPAYIHKYYVDLPPTISDAYVKTTAAGTVDWHTILISGQRAGGRSIAALDVTDPTAFTEANAANLVMWEFSHADLGYTFSEPTIALMNDGKWAAIFGNGYNDTGSGEAKLFIVYLEGGLDGTWTSSTDYQVITTGVGSSGSRNGLSTPAIVDLDGDGDADRAYAGDLAGNMWAFDLSSSTASNWEVAYKTGSTPKPLFTTQSNQPITIEPVITEHPTVTSASSNAPNLMVYFGTGQYLTDADKTTTYTQSFYGVWDDGTKELDYSDLQQQTFETGFASNIRVLTKETTDYTASGPSKEYGWYLNLPTSGERVVVNPIARGSIVFFNTLIPSSDPCSYGGSGWLMGVDSTYGGRPESDNKIFDVNGDGNIDNNDLVDNADESITDVPPDGIQYEGGIPAESAILGNYMYTPGTNTNDGSDIQVNLIQGLGSADTGRLSWQEIRGE